MFANPIWSVLLLAAPVALYWFVIRPRLQSKFTEIYADLDSFWARLWARIYAFRTFWLATVTAVITAAPDILSSIAPLDFTGVLPQPWPAYTSAGCTIAVTLMKAFETKPGESK